MVRRRLRRGRAGDRLDGASSRRGTLTAREHQGPEAVDLRGAWRAGREDLREALAPYVRALISGGEPPAALEVFRDKPGRRRLARARLPSGPGCFFKYYPAAAGRGLRDLWKRTLGLSPASREFAHLRRLHARGVGVPEPLALYRFARGDSVLVTRLIEGEPLHRALSEGGPQRRALLREVGALVARLHAAGFCHRDLHAGNVWSTREGPVLLDLPAALPAAPRWLRLRDLGELDMSLAEALSLADRLRLRASALGLERPFAANARARLRAVGRSSQARRRAYLASRTRRCLRPGRLYAALRIDGGRGLRLRDCEESRLRAALSTPPQDGSPDLLRFDSRGRRPWRSAARRCWVAGHGLHARGLGTPRPLAFLEWPAPRRSALWLEPTRVAKPESDPHRLRAIVELASGLRRDGVEHAGLADAELRIDTHGRLGLPPSEAIRFRRRLSAGSCARIDAWVASRIAASGASPTERSDALARYAARTRFLPGPPARAQVFEIVTQRK